MTAAQALHRAAFHGSPRDAVSLLPRDALTGQTAWLAGVALGAVGRYGDALAALADAEADPQWRSQALSTSASLHRQLGRHRAARDLDEHALAVAESDLDRADALTGLAADAVGLGDAEAAGALLEQASPLAEQWRRQVRWNWVSAEVDLLTGRPELALDRALAAVDAARAHGAPRHLAKGRLIAGVAAATAGDARAGALLGSALDTARSLGAWPLVWPAALVLARRAGQPQPLLAQARAVTAAIGLGLPEPLRGEWQESVLRTVR